MNDLVTVFAVAAVSVVVFVLFVYVWYRAHVDTSPWDEERKQWRGKVRVGERRNSLGQVQYCADYKTRWFLSWNSVYASEEKVEIADDYYGYPLTFDTFEAAKIAAQLKWNKASAKYDADRKARFGDWRKVWP